MGDHNHPYQIEAFDIFHTAWLELQYSKRRPSSSHATTDEIVEQAADKLSAATAAADNPGSFLYSTLSAIVDHGSQAPASLDLMLQAYILAANKLPASVSSDYGKGSAAAIGELNWWIAEEADLFNPPLPPVQDLPGKAFAGDCSNPLFQQSDVKNRLNTVLDYTQEWRKERGTWILMLAAKGRCYSLDLVRSNGGNNAIAQVEAAFNIWAETWSEAQLVGAAILLRSCAKSLAADSNKVAKWVGNLEALLWREGVNFTTKSHSELLLRNLRSGPHDETSEELFQWKEWLL